MAMGLLQVVATPIGNLQDLSPRAAAALAAADWVLCEDTRHTGVLLRHLGLHKPTASLHAHNEGARVAEVLARLAEGAQIALVSDAGTPCLSDPGERLVDAVHAAGHAVQTLPGPFAAAAALAASGLVAVPFAFWGFVAKRSGERQRDFDRQLQPGPEGAMTHAFYVPGRDLDDVLADIAAVVPAARVCVARELTKVHEQVVRGAASSLRQQLQPEQLRGEAVVLVEVGARQRNQATADDAATLVQAARAAGEHPKHALKRIGAATGLSRQALYALWTAAGGDPRQD